MEFPLPSGRRRHDDRSTGLEVGQRQHGQRRDAGILASRAVRPLLLAGTDVRGAARPVELDDVSPTTAGAPWALLAVWLRPSRKHPTAARSAALPALQLQRLRQLRLLRRRESHQRRAAGPARRAAKLRPSRAGTQQKAEHNEPYFFIGQQRENARRAMIQLNVMIERVQDCVADLSANGVCLDHLTTRSLREFIAAERDYFHLMLGYDARDREILQLLRMWLRQSR